MTGTPGAATYVKTTSGSIITVVPKSLATLGGKIISSNIVSGKNTSIAFLPKTPGTRTVALLRLPLGLLWGLTYLSAQWRSPLGAGNGMKKHPQSA